MKKQLFIKDIAGPDTVVKDYFLVAAKTLSLTKENKRYLSLTLRDKTGVIEGRVWEEADVQRLAGGFEKGDIVFVTARTSLFQGKVQLRVRDATRVDTQVNPADLKDFYSAPEKDIKELVADYRGRVYRLTDPHLRSLFAALGKRQSLLDGFFLVPASVGVHHVYPGGLLEHSLTVAHLAEKASSVVGGNREIIVAGSLLHDIGKVEEIEMRDGFSYSDRGRLLGHITLGVMILADLLKSLDNFPAVMADMLSHIIVSHHGMEEWGSPRKPMSVEALIVHYVDNLDAKVMGVKEYMRENMADKYWTDYHRLYESRFFKLPEGPYGSETDIC